MPLLECLGNFIGERIVGCLLRPIGEQICNMYNFKSNVRKLKEQAEKLELSKTSVLHAVDEADKQGDKIEANVCRWLDEVIDFNKRLSHVTKEDEEEKPKKHCFKGLLCPNLKICCLHKTEVIGMVKECADLLREGHFPRVAYPNQLQRTRSKYVKEEDDFASRQSIFDDVMETLKTTNIKVIGLHGMGGVGKTTLVNKIYCQLKNEDKMFDRVAMAEVRQHPNIMKIQKDIAGDLGLRFHEDESCRHRADRLREQLKKEKSVLVILDDVWEELHLDAIGIPLGNAAQRHCKILLTSRDQNVCKLMETEKNIPVMPLSFEEAWTLFWKVVDDPEKSPRFGSIAAKIVKKCAGLPVAIMTIAKTLKHEDHAVWNEILNELENFKFTGLEDFHSVIELSYKFLKNEDAKSLFLLCGLHAVGKFIVVEDLVRYVMGLGLFQHVNTLKVVRKKVDRSIKVLKAASLLLDDGGKDFIKVHDVIHIVAQAIASRDKLMFNIQVVDRLEGELEKHHYENSKAIALHYVDAHELPAMPEFTRLEFMLIKYSSSKLPDRFFDRMKGLKVLFVYEGSLSASLGCLMNLKTLCLDDCCLGYISAIGELKKLEVLSFSGSNIKKLPEEIGELAWLKLLDLERCSHLEEIPRNVLSKLKRLEELYIGDSFVNWDARNNASLTELKQLNRLTILSIHFRDAQIIPQDFFLEKLKKYMIVVGEGWESDWAFSWENSRTLKLKISNRNYLEFGVKKLLKKTKNLYLDNLNGFKNIHPELGGEGFPDLKSLRVQNDPHILHIFRLIEECEGYGTYPKLESLFLCNLINLEKICHGELRAKTFGNLKIINVEKCAALTHLIPYSMAKPFLHLQEIKMANCTNLKEIVGKEMQDKNISKIVFSELHTLTLTCLPKLMSFGPTASLRSGEIVQGDDQNDFMILFGRKVSFPNLENLHLSSLETPSVWCSQLRSSYSLSEKLTNLVVEKCAGLKFLFSSSMVNGLQQLEKLDVAYCESMEVIINTEGSRGEDNRHDINFPSLKLIWIRCCPNLKEFLSSSMYENKKAGSEPRTLSRMSSTKPFFDEKIELPALEKLKLSSVGNLECLCTTSMASISLAHLQELEIEDCAKMKEIITERGGKDIATVEIAVFSKLHRLCLKGLPELKMFCSFSGHTIKLDSLSHLKISNCLNMQNFVSNPLSISLTPKLKPEETNPEKNIHADAIPLFDEKILLPDLKSLKIRDMHNLRRIWHNVLYPTSLCSLEVLKLFDCEKLCNVFPYDMLDRLKRLKCLYLWSCNSLNEIFDVPETSSSMEKNTIPRIIFPELTQLSLSKLSKLKSFYHGLHISEWPSLKELWVCTCDNMEIFGSEFHSLRQGNKDVPQPLFVVDKGGFPTLELLKLHWNRNLKEMWRGGRLTSKAPQLKTLSLEECDPLVQVFHLEGPDANSHSELLPELTNFRLVELPRLRNIWSKSHLEILGFLGLKKLFVSKCNSLRYVFTTSIILSLKQLQEVEIRDCAMVETIITEDREKDDSMRAIIIPQLEIIVLKCLPKLKCFHSGSNGLECSSLKTITITDCRQMKSFVFASTEDLYIQDTPFFTEKVAFRSLEKLKLSKLPEVEHPWNESCKAFEKLATIRISKCVNLKSLVPSSTPFPNLTTLEVSQCDRLTSLVALPIAKSLEQLNRINISDCKIMGEIITHMGDEENDRVVFGQLEYIGLHCLPSITGFYLGDYTTDFPALEQVFVRQCPKMNTFSKGVVNAPKLKSVQTTEDEECVGKTILIPPYNYYLKKRLSMKIGFNHRNKSKMKLLLKSLIVHSCYGLICER